MKNLMVGMAILFASGATSAQSDTKRAWWSYLAAYDEGPGSIRLDVSLRKVAPVKAYPYVVVTGITYASDGQQGFPEPGDIDRINRISDAVVAAIASKTSSIYAGTFTHHFEQLNYVYVSSVDGLAEVIEDVYSRLCAGCKTYTNIKSDAPWATYNDFLFPNKVTRDYYGVQFD
jgi:hypothetical protein